MSKYPPKQFAHLVDRTSKIKLMAPYRVKLSYEYRENQYDADTGKYKSITKKVLVSRGFK